MTERELKEIEKAQLQEAGTPKLSWGWSGVITDLLREIRNKWSELEALQQEIDNLHGFKQ